MNRWLLYLLCAIVLLQSALLWKLCALHRALLADVACVPALIVEDSGTDNYVRPLDPERGGPLL